MYINNESLQVVKTFIYDFLYNIHVIDKYK